VICEVCGKEKWPDNAILGGDALCSRTHPHGGTRGAAACLFVGYEREKARAEETERQLASCKESWRVSTLVVAETEARADRYEAEFSACKALLIAAQQRAERAEAERAEAQEFIRSVVEYDEYRDDDEDPLQILARIEARAREVLRALAALPVEPARRQVTEITQEAGTAVPTPLRLCRAPTFAGAMECRLPRGHDGDHAFRAPGEAEPARSPDQPAPQNPPPSPTGDAE
jgi:hypothetical protein